MKGNPVQKCLKSRVIKSVQFGVGLMDLLAQSSSSVGRQPCPVCCTRVEMLVQAVLTGPGKMISGIILVKGLNLEPKIR